MTFSRSGVAAAVVTNWIFHQGKDRVKGNFILRKILQLSDTMVLQMKSLRDKILDLVFILTLGAFWFLLFHGISLWKVTFAPGSYLG
jgi:hypothetical protein